MRGLIPVMLAATAATAALAWRDEPALNESERQLFERLDSLVAGGPPRSSEIVRAFSLPAQCERGSCFFAQSEIANPVFAGGNLRPTEEGLVFVLERPRGQCIRIDRAVAHFGTGEVEQSCSDSDCWYVKASHGWGILGFGLESPAATCAASVVINSLPYQRPRDDAR
jgi:hypothetical protein